jgi:hypothetical protein
MALLLVWPSPVYSMVTTICRAGYMQPPTGPLALLEGPALERTLPRHARQG